MDAKFWQERWEQSIIGFHREDVNPLLLRHFGELRLAPGARVFVPLCGKTLDISWLRSSGFRVAGAELSAIAVEQLFEQLKLTPGITDLGALKLYRAEGIDVFVGDIFDLSKELLGPVDAVYDRAALVALPEEVRRRYTVHLMEITHAARQLLICYEYDQSVANGPPFSVTGEEAMRHYQKRYAVRRLSSLEVHGGLKGRCPATETVWLLNGG